MSFKQLLWLMEGVGYVELDDSLSSRLTGVSHHTLSRLSFRGSTILPPRAGKLILLATTQRESDVAELAKLLYVRIL